MERDFPPGAALVVGGSGGIGGGIARGLALAGSSVAIGYRSRADAASALRQSVTADCQAAGGEAPAIATVGLDVTDPASLQTAVARVVSDFGALHTLVFAAGPVVEQLPLAEVSPRQWRQAVEVESLGFANAVHACLPALRESRGSVVHVGSAGDRSWPARDGLSVVPKAANEALVRGIAREEGRHGVRANSVLAGVIEAGMFLELSRRGVFDQAWVDETHKLLALKRWGQPEELADAVVFLASRRAAYITGEQLNVSGGFGL